MSERVEHLRQWLADQSEGFRADLARALRMLESAESETPVPEPVPEPEPAEPEESDIEAERARLRETWPKLLRSRTGNDLPPPEHCPNEHPEIIEALRNHQRERDVAEGRRIPFY